MQVMQKPLLQSQGAVGNISLDRTQAMSPARLAKLPPISSMSPQTENPSAILLQSATTELKDTMQHLLDEVST